MPARRNRYSLETGFSETSVELSENETLQGVRSQHPVSPSYEQVKLLLNLRGFVYVQGRRPGKLILAKCGRNMLFLASKTR
jgi:type II secretory pathway component PulC